MNNYFDIPIELISATVSCPKVTLPALSFSIGTIYEINAGEKGLNLDTGKSYPITRRYILKERKRKWFEVWKSKTKRFWKRDDENEER